MKTDRVQLLMQASPGFGTKNGTSSGQSRKSCRPHREFQNNQIRAVLEKHIDFVREHMGVRPFWSPVQCSVSKHDLTRFENLWETRSGRRTLGPIHTGHTGANVNKWNLLVRMGVSVHTTREQHQRIGVQICLLASCVKDHGDGAPLRCFSIQCQESRR